MIKNLTDWNQDQLNWYVREIAWYKDQLKAMKELGMYEYIPDMEKALRHNYYMARKYRQKLAA